jgi:predicted TPR repeat methyltransferase
MTNFDDAALTWDTPMRCERALALAAAVRDAWGDSPQTVLDFGCGTGLLSFALRNDAAEISGYDPSAEMGKIFEAKRAMYQADNVRLVSEARMWSSAYDVIFSSMVLHHIKDVRATVERIYRMLAPGGRFLWIDLDEEDGSFHANEPGFDGHNGFPRCEVEDILKGAGFREISIQTVYRGERTMDGRPVPYSLFMAVAHGLPPTGG